MMQPMMYPPLPTLAARRADETAEQYGLRALAFVVATETTAGLDDDALALADHCYRLAIDNRDLLPAIVDQLANVQRRIAAALRVRTELTAAAEQATTMPEDAPAGRDKPNLGPMAPLSPQPTPRPPAGILAEVPAERRQPMTRDEISF
jgi:hypothetical protein